MRYLSFCIANPEELDGCLEKLTAKLVLQGATVNIVCSDRRHWDLLNLQEGQDLSVNIQKHYNSLHWDTS